MRIETLYDPGTVKAQEDELIVSLRKNRALLGVADGVSGLYLPEKGPRTFEGKTGGQMAAGTLVSAVSDASENNSLLSILKATNDAIGKAQFDVSMKSSELLAGTTFALAKITDTTIEVATVGDAMAWWQTKDGAFHGTDNQVFCHDMEMRRVIASLMQKHDADRSAMWAEFSPFLTKKRRERTNRSGPCSYGLLNGDSRVLDKTAFNTIKIADIRFLLLFTDGLVSYPETGNIVNLGEIIFPLYEKGGLETILARTRGIEEAEKKSSHVDHAEATAVALQF